MTVLVRPNSFSIGAVAAVGRSGEEGLREARHRQRIGDASHYRKCEEQQQSGA